MKKYIENKTKRYASSNVNRTASNRSWPKSVWKWKWEWNCAKSPRKPPKTEKQVALSASA